jgi:hypothetical protein
MKKQVFVVSLAALTAITPVTVNAKTSSQLNKSGVIATDSWSIVAQAASQGSGQATTSTSYPLSWTVSSGNAYHYFSLHNQGSLLVINISLIISQTRVGGNGAANEVFFEWCANGVWNITTNSCSGTIVLLGSSLQSSLTMANVNLIVGANLQLRAVTAVSGRNNFSTSVSPIVSRGDVRVGSVRNS